MLYLREAVDMLMHIACAAAHAQGSAIIQSIQAHVFGRQWIECLSIADVHVGK